MVRRRTSLRNGTIQRRVLFALERTRSRLAVAFAAESKRTYAIRWHAYVAIDDRVRQFLRRLRAGRVQDPCDPAEWADALEKLENLQPVTTPDPGQGSAQLLSQRIADALAKLDANPEPQNSVRWIILREGPQDR